MTTGWKYIRDDGEEYKSSIQAAQSLLERPESTFLFSELDMSGTHLSDATSEVQYTFDKYIKGGEVGE
jgi:hypothetical protein